MINIYRYSRLKHIDIPSGCFIDRMKEEPDLEPVEVIMVTLNAENFLEKCLYTVYREIPVRKLIVCDGGSKDSTHEVFKKFPRVNLLVKPEIRTTGKALEYLMSLIDTDWFVIIDSDIELDRGWYDEMCSHKDEYDVLENSKRVLAYHLYREDKIKLQQNIRSLDFCHLVNKSSIKNYHCDDDYMWRFTDFLLRQVVENSGHRYGKISTTKHIHNETEINQSKSDNEKNFEKVIWKVPERILIDKEKAKQSKINHAKAIVKYLDPNSVLVRNDKGIDSLIRLLNRGWVEENGTAWLERYDQASRIRLNQKKFLSRIGQRLKMRFF